MLLPSRLLTTSRQRLLPKALRTRRLRTILLAGGLVLAACGRNGDGVVSNTVDSTAAVATTAPVPTSVIATPPSTAAAATTAPTTFTSTTTVPTTTTPLSEAASSTTAASIATVPATDSSTTAVPTTTTPLVATASSTTAAPRATVPATAAPAPVAPAEPNGGFASEVFEISGPLVDRFEHSWREGCPVGLDQLRLIALTHWDFDGNIASGELVIHADHTADVVAVFARLFDAKFPIERMELVDNFLGDDDLSMEANNTSGFNCREIASRPGTWSNHAFGAAIDINPLVNPYVRGSQVLPPGGAEFVDRSEHVQGGIYAGDAVTQAFADIGWGWGGDWNTLKDWQHFSASGN